MDGTLIGSPKDIGLPTSIEWTLPDDFKPTIFNFPFSPLRDSGIVSYGYDHEVMFSRQRLMFPKTFQQMTLKSKECTVVGANRVHPYSNTRHASPSKSKRGGDAFTGLFEHYAKQHPTPPSEVERFAIEAALSVSAVQPNLFSLPFTSIRWVEALPMLQKRTHGHW